MSAGRLVVVATPIGNLGDLSPRAAAALAEANVVACEDTRRTGRLFQLANIAPRPPFIVVNDHTEADRGAAIVQRISGGETVALVSDAGMPGVADPGERLVAAVIEAGLPVEVIPGPSALLAALVASGLTTHTFCFEGFLPKKASGRAARLAELATEPRTMILYESPHRVAALMADLADAFGPARRCAIARELTKMHEEIWRGSLAEAVAWLADQVVRGEVAVVVEGAPAPDGPTDAEVVAELQRALGNGTSRRDAAAAVARHLGIAKRRAYALAMELS